MLGHDDAYRDIYIRIESLLDAGIDIGGHQFSFLHYSNRYHSHPSNYLLVVNSAHKDAGSL
jgi:hypothetical protein